MVAKTSDIYIKCNERRQSPEQISNWYTIFTLNEQTDSVDSNQTVPKAICIMAAKTVIQTFQAAILFVFLSISRAPDKGVSRLIFFLFLHKIYAVCIHKKCLTKAFLTSTYYICLCGEIKNSKTFWIITKTRLFKYTENFNTKN